MQNYGLIKSLDELKSLLDHLEQAVSAGARIGFDIETGYSGALDRKKGSLDVAWEEQFISGFSISSHPGMARYVPVAHDTGNNLEEEKAWELVKPFLESAPIVAHNAKYETMNLMALDRKGRGPSIALNVECDTMLSAYVLSEWPRTGLKDLVEWVFGHKMAHITDLFPNLTAKQMDALRFNVLELSPEVVSYACEDAAWCLALQQKIDARAREERAFMHGLEHKIMSVMADVEDYGVQVDFSAMQRAALQAPAFVARMEKAVKDGFSEMLGGQDLSGLNLGSAAQLGKLFYEPAPAGLGLPPVKLSAKTQKPSTDAIALERLSREIKPIKKLLELREVNNLVRRLDKWLHEQGDFSSDGRVHASYGQTIVPTGRFAANEPAIQQCPKDWRWTIEETDFNIWDDDQTQWKDWTLARDNGKDFWAGNFRDFIVARDGFYLLTYDYSQIELRTLAGMSREPSLVKAFAEGQDVHTLTAAKMLGKTPSEVSKKDRAIGKTMNFALIYGMGPKSLADRLALSPTRARELYDEYFSQFPAVAMWMQRTKETGKRQGYVETYFKRKMTVWELQSDNRAIYAKAERVMGNYPIQGTGSGDIPKIAMVRAAAKLRYLGWWKSKCTIVMNQHDSLTFEVSNELDPCEVRAVLEAAVVFEVPNFPTIVSDWELGQKWGSSSPWKDDKVPVWSEGQWQLETRPLSTGSMEPVPAMAEGAEEVLPSTSGVEDGFNVAEELEADLTSPEPEPSSRTIIVELEEFPTEEALDKLLDLLESRPGHNRIVLCTSSEEINLWDGTSVDIDDYRQIALALPGARCRVPAEEVNSEVLVGDLSL